MDCCTALVGLVFLIIKIFILEISLNEEFTLLFLTLFSIIAFFLLKIKPYLLNYIQVIIVYSIILLFVLNYFQKINIYQFLTLFISFIIFGIFLYINALIIENYEKDRIKNKYKLKELANTDYLTGILNRRAFFNLVNTLELNKYSVLMLDIDHFKKINDTYGHDIGDKVLKTFSNTIKNNLRKEDIFARIGKKSL